MPINVSDKTKELKEELGAGQFVLEADDGGEPVKIQIDTVADVLTEAGAVAYTLRAAVRDQDGNVTPLALAAGTHTSMLGNEDFDPVLQLQAAIEKEARRAFLAQKQMAALSALGIPSRAELEKVVGVEVDEKAVELVDAEVAAEDAAIMDEAEFAFGGAGNDLLEAAEGNDQLKE